jgi:GH24 family phage-related lysozyme (muramidase)
MANDLQLKIGADNSELVRVLESSRRSADDFTSSLKDDSLSLNETLKELNRTLKQIAGSTDETAQATRNLSSYADWAFYLGILKIVGQAVYGLGSLTVGAATAAAEGMVSLAKAAEGAAVSFIELERAEAYVYGQTNAVRVSHSVLGEMLVALQEHSQWSSVFASTQEKATERTIALATSMSRVNQEIQSIGFVGASDGLSRFVTELMKIPGMTQEVASAIEASFATLPKFTGELNSALVQTIRLVANSKEEAKKFAETFATAFSNPEANGERFLRSLGEINPKLLESFETAKQTGNTYRMQAVLLDGNLELVRRSRDEWTRQLNESVRFYSFLGLSRDVALVIESLFNRNVAHLRDLNAEANEQIEKIIEMRNRLQDFSFTQEEIRRKAFDIAQSYSTPSRAIEKLTSDIGFLKAAAGEATTDVIELIKHYEGFTKKAEIDSDGRYRMGFGSDTTTDEQGNVRTVTQGMVTTYEDALRDLRRRVAEYQRDLANTIGEPWTRLPVSAQAAITSVAYNYAKNIDGLKAKLPSFIEALKTGDRGTIANYVSARAADNDGINARRRNQEAAIIRGEVQEQKMYNESLKVAQSNLKAMNDLRDGGNVIQKTELAIAEEKARGISDELEQRKRIIESLETEADDERLTESQRSEVNRRLFSERAQLRELEIGRMRAQAQVEASIYGLSAKQRFEILNAELTQEADLRKNEPDKLREVEQRKLAIKREFDQYRRAASMQQAELDIARDRARGISDEVAEHKKRISVLQEQRVSEEDPDKQLELDRRIASERAQLREREISRMRAQAEREADEFEIGTKERYEILRKELEKEIELRKSEPDKLRELERRRIALKDEFEFQGARTQQTEADIGLQERMNQLREEAVVAREAMGMKRIDDDELKAVLLRNIDEREQAERNYWQSVMKMWEGAPTQYDRAQKRLSGLTSKYSLERANTERQFNQQTFKEYESTFRSIYQSVSSSMTGVLMGQQKLSQGIRSILGSMLQMVLSKLVEKAAAWSATMALELTTTQATEAGKTAAVAGGEASRTGLMAAGGVAQLATRGMTMLKSILASAAETFAGVFAFLSPVMGPAAAGPAAAAQGTVAAQAAAVAAFDIGAWEIPGDQLAMVHRRELVMPAAEADAFRRLLSGGLEHRVTGSQVPSIDARRLEAEGGKSDLAKTLPSFISQVASTIERTTERAPGAQAQSHSDLVAAIKAAIPATGQGVAHLAKLAGDGGARIAGALTVLPVLAGPAVASPVRDLATVIRQAGDSGVRFDVGASAERGVSVNVTSSYGEIFGREARTSPLDLRSLAAAGGKDAQADQAAGKALPRAADRVATVLSDTLARSDVTSASSHAQFRSELTSTLERSFPATAHGLTQLISLASGEGARAASLMSVLPTAAQPGIADLKSFHALSNFINHESSSIDSINSYAIGAWNIPNDQLAVLHRRELVMPVNEATAFRNLLTASPGGEGGDGASGGSGGTHNHHYNISPTINAVDARSVKRLFSSHSSELMEAFSKSVKLGHHLTKPNLRPS